MTTETTSPPVAENTSDAGKVQSEIEIAEDIKSTVFDSAELATRSASLAAKAGMEMHLAAQELLKTTASQQKINKILLGVFGGVSLLALVLFAIMSLRMQDRVSQLDAMVLAVGKRVVSMDASVDLFNGVSDIVKDVSQKQDSISNAQAKLELRIDEAILNTQTVPDPKAKPADDKSKEMLKLMQDIHARVQQDANSLKSVSAQIQKLQSNLPDTSHFRRDMEVLLRQVKERPAPVVAPSVAVTPVVKPSERLVQYPRVSAPGVTPEKP